MSGIIIGKHGKRDVSIDLGVLLKTRALIQAGSGGGKSYLLRRLAEQSVGKVQTFIIDRDGEFSSLREKFNFVLAGEEGDTQTDIRSARLLAEKLLELRASAIFDLYEAFRTKPGNRRAWVRGFLEGVMDAPKKFWRPLLVIVDEAHLFCPQESPKAASMVEREIIAGCKDAMVSLATAGRKRGFCAVWATQRLAKLDKDASAELLNRFVGNTIEDVDVDRAADLMSVSRDEKLAFKKSLKNLEPGHFFGFGRAVSKDRILIRVGRVKTTHPESGSSKYAAGPPPAPEKIRGLLPKLKDLPKEVETKAKTEAQLRVEIQTLRKQLTQKDREKPKVVPAPAPAPVQTTKIKIKQIEVPVLKPAIINGLNKAVKRMEKAKDEMGFSSQAVEIAANSIACAISTAVDGYEKLKKATREGPAGCPPGLKGQPGKVGWGRNDGKGRSAASPIVKKRSGPSKPIPMEETDLLKGERNMLEVLAQFHPGNRTRSQLGALTDLTPSGGTFGNYYGRLKKKGYIKEQIDGSIGITEEGLELFGDSLPAGPGSPEELVAMWRGKLLKGEREMLDAVMGHYPKSISREELGEEIGKAHGGGTFGNYLGTLRRNQLVTVDKEQVRAADTLFEFAGA